MALTIGLCLLLYSGAAAQSSGQLCVRAYEDRNSNGKLDGGEPVITKGVAVSLLDARNVIVGSALLDTAPNGAQGVMCFQGLTPGQYTVSMSAPDYSATTAESITTTITASGLLTVVEYGGKPLAAPASATNTATVPLDQRELITRLVIAGVGTLVVITLMGFLGVIVYALAFRRRAQPAASMRVTTDSMAAIRKTGEVRRP
jgi:hypothetical protein